MSSLEVLGESKLELGLVRNIVKDYTYLANGLKSFVLCWIASLGRR